MFKQIIGAAPACGMITVNSFSAFFDYNGSATRCSQTDFDGDPIQVIETQIDDGLETRPPRAEQVPIECPGTSTLPPDQPTPERRKFYFDGGQVEIAAHLVYELDPDGRQLRVVGYTEYTAEKVRTLYPNAASLRREWATPDMRSEIIEKLADRGIDFDELAKTAGQPDADPFDLICIWRSTRR